MMMLLIAYTVLKYTALDIISNIFNRKIINISYPSVLKRKIVNIFLPISSDIYIVVPTTYGLVEK